MSYQHNKTTFFRLMNRFVNGDIDAATFVTIFLRMWKSDRDEQLAIKATWDRPHDQEIIAAFKRGEISESELRAKWNALWNMSTEMAEFQHMLDKAMSACDAFDPNPTLARSIYYDENELRHHVGAILKDFNAGTPGPDAKDAPEKGPEKGDIHDSCGD